MSTRTTLHRLALASAVAAMLASAAPGAFAQTTDTPAPPATTTPDTTTPSSGTGMTATPPSSGTDSPAPMSGSTSSMPMSGGTSSMPMSGSTVPTPPMNLPTDYRVLNNRIFDATDLEQARARGLSDNQIATVVKISRETTLPFNQVVAMVERGETFPAIATTYGLKLGDVYSNDKEKQQISDYDALSMYAKSLGKSDTSMASMPMSSGSSTMTPPMTPSTPPVTPTDTTTSMNPVGQLDIVETASAAKNLTTLVKLIQIAGLSETLKGAGPFTVFAPDDRAFSRLPAGTLDALEADPARLKAVLTYHVIPLNIMAADAMAMTSPTSPPTVEGATLQVTKGRRGRLRVNDATVTKADIRASNGTIHIINMVLMPPTTDTTATQSTTTDTTTPPAAPTNVTPPAAPATPGTTDVTPVTPGTTNTPAGTTSGMSGATPGTSGATPGTTGTTPGTTPGTTDTTPGTTPATPGTTGTAPATPGQ